ncbi:hypothetical protein AKJ09_09101 [Labilithrix luteola]|uniref:BNR repeat domain protein n=1 Tax=Labilithrix luteola TaxID=1391654 RepID=A0A0K1Q9M9_9BACT|nr:RCC1 domain-containing protein [Labilithrix luteola]AKV02438.1 hypothetical protein AKJ09_09101 [Labilithrix luteola]
MRFTRRLLDRRAAAAVAVVSLLPTALVSASCAASDATPGFDPTDAAPETSRSDAAVGNDAGELDASRDVEAFDATARSVECASAHCATSLSTVQTTGAWDDYTEGFCALLQDGTVACWGTDRGGQLGRGDEAGALGSSSTPQRVVGLSNVSALDHTCAVEKDGTAWCWGTGPFVRSDAAAVTTERTPVKLPIPPAKKVATGRTAACAIVGEGVFCWGQNDNGQIAPAKVAPFNAVLEPREVPLPAGAPLRDLIVGRASFVLREDGTATSWGANPPLARVSSLFPDPYPLQIGLSGVSSLDNVSENACATAGGTGYCWGNVISLWNSTDRAIPEPVVAPEPLVQIATTDAWSSYDTATSTAVAHPQRWCATAASGAVYCWGYNASGQAGDGTNDHAYHAVKVTGLPAPAVQVKTLPDSTCALLTNGSIFCWGSNGYGQLGNGTGQGSRVPQEVVLP